MSAPCIFPSRVVLGAMCFAAALFGIAAPAQMTGTIGRVTVPFPFVSGDASLPAGSYTLVFNSEHIVALKGEHDVGMLSVVLDEVRNNRSKARLVFRQEDGVYVLRDIWNPARDLHLISVQRRRRANQPALARNEGGPAVEVVSLN